ncbi:erythromycin esterase [Amycolatopsis rhizosphaerae]|uniref:Erythromycin esterase n=1 Tax=Amycolatopsis rhizosphaerae TaxID=2053003 RepID=A0A558AVV9_9PSEU|nr:DUF6194 family protein [Amycolatopsis rhizosphaerae]TVT28398.1 erythromycin esterase [Amycolatopsis rhizosphaerae]
MNEQQIIRFVGALPEAVVEVASESTGAPRVAWGDTFFFYNPAGVVPQGELPFATIVTKDYPDYDTASRLDRPGVFRLNISVGRALFQELTGYPPAAHADRQAGFDYTAFDRVLPHPVYATQGWVCVLNPGEATAKQVESLVTEAHARAARRYRAASRS